MTPPEESKGTSAPSFFRRKGEAERSPQPAPGLAAGKVVGDFRLVSLIGQGGMGQVWEAEQVSLRRRVAVKFVRPERVTAHQLQLFAREARAGGRLNHPGIVSVFGHGESDGLAWIAMELVSGAWTLKDFLDDAARAPEVPEGYDPSLRSRASRLRELVAKGEAPPERPCVSRPRRKGAGHLDRVDAYSILWERVVLGRGGVLAHHGSARCAARQPRRSAAEAA